MARVEESGAAGMERVGGALVEVSGMWRRVLDWMKVEKTAVE